MELCHNCREKLLGLLGWVHVQPPKPFGLSDLGLKKDFDHCCAIDIDDMDDMFRKNRGGKNGKNNKSSKIIQNSTISALNARGFGIKTGHPFQIPYTMGLMNSLPM